MTTDPRTTAPAVRDTDFPVIACPTRFVGGIVQACVNYSQEDVGFVFLKEFQAIGAKFPLEAPGGECFIRVPRKFLTLVEAFISGAYDAERNFARRF